MICWITFFLKYLILYLVLCTESYHLDGHHHPIDFADSSIDGGETPLANLLVQIIVL